VGNTDDFQVGQRVGFSSLARDARGFRSDPDATAPVVSWPMFVKCTVEQVDGEWARLRSPSGTEGWVRTSFLRAAPINVPSVAAKPDASEPEDLTAAALETTAKTQHESAQADEPPPVADETMTTIEAAPEPAADDETRAVTTVQDSRSCVACGGNWPSTSIFCGDCGSRFDAPAEDTTELAFPTRHLTPDGGIQAMVEPDPNAALARFLPGRAAVQVLARRGAWARVREDDDAEDKASWVDGRRLIPPVEDSLLGTPPSVIRPVGVRNPVPTASAIAGVLGGVGVIIGALVDWYQVGPTNAFHIPIAFLFDTSTTDLNPKLAYFLLALGLVGGILSLVPGTGWVRAACGALALTAGILFAVRIGDAISFSSTVDVTDVMGAGPWVTGISGLLLLASPVIGSSDLGILNFQSGR
jgi:hypothetical protein